MDQYNYRIGTLPNIPPNWQQDFNQVQQAMSGGFQQPYGVPGNPYMPNYNNGPMPAFGAPFVQTMAGQVVPQYSGANQNLDILEQDFRRRAPRMQLDDFYGRVVAPIAGGAMGMMGSQGALDAASTQSANVVKELNDLRSFGGDLVNARRALMQDAYKMAQDTDPYSIDNRYRGVQQAVSLDRAQSYANQVANQLEASKLRAETAEKERQRKEADDKRDDLQKQLDRFLKEKTEDRRQKQGDRGLDIKAQNADTQRTNTIGLNQRREAQTVNDTQRRDLRAEAQAETRRKNLSDEDAKTAKRLMDETEMETKQHFDKDNNGVPVNPGASKVLRVKLARLARTKLGPSATHDQVIAEAQRMYAHFYGGN